MEQFNSLLNAVGIKWAVVLVTLYWLGTRVAPWFRPHADRLLLILAKRLAADLKVDGECSCVPENAEACSNCPPEKTARYRVVEAAGKTS